MLISQEVSGGPTTRQGSRSSELAELRRALAEPTRMTRRHRQRLLDMAQRVARIGKLGEEYRRVSLSDLASATVNGAASA